MADLNVRNNKKRGQSNFSGGVNTEQLPVDLSDTESTDEYGFDTDAFPALTTRKGRQRYGTSGGAQTRLMASLGNSQLIRAVGGAIQRDDGGSWTTIGSLSDGYFDAANFEVDGTPSLILVNGVDAPRYWNGTALNTLGGTPPVGKFITADPSRVFIAKGDILFFSGFQKPEDWSSTENSGFSQYYTFAGGDITALYGYKDIKYLFKKDSMAGLYGVNYFDYRIVEISNSIGCVSNNTVQEVNDRLIWLGQSDVYQFTQGNPTPIGGKIRTYLDRINAAQVEKCNAFSDGHRYYLNLVIDGATEPNIRLVFDTRYNIWHVCAKSESFRAGMQFNNVLYAGDASGQTYKVNVGDSDDGVAIPWSVTSKAFDEEIGEAEKEYKEMHIQGSFSGTSTLSVSVSMQDRGESFVAVNYDPIGNANVSLSKNIIIPMDTMPLAYWMRYRLSGSGPVSIYNIQRYFRICRVQH
ncbi:hypothetical protein [Paenibacillus sp. FSL L8-0499]|uniref:hypothetical protein n=1 Tax=Paenibacillus sp. FSL L8-0499 TaxID=2975334 RepID=UPI0030FBB200